MHLNLTGPIIESVFIRVVVGANAVRAGEHRILCDAHTGASGLLNDVSDTRHQPFVTGASKARQRLLHMPV